MTASSAGIRFSSEAILRVTSHSLSVRGSGTLLPQSHLRPHLSPLRSLSVPRRLFRCIRAVCIGAIAADSPVIKSAKSGSWSAPSTWEGNAVPGTGARVLIRENHAVTYDGKSDAVIALSTSAGSPTFARPIKIRCAERWAHQDLASGRHLQVKMALIAITSQKRTINTARR